MKSDIEFKKVEDIAIAIIPNRQEEGETEWQAHLLNLKEKDIQSVLVNSRGYGEKDGKAVKTSVLRHFYENIPSKAAVVIELVPEQLFGLNNEFWVSFWCDDFMYDKKYVFVSEALVETNLTLVPIIEKQGVMIR